MSQLTSNLSDLEVQLSFGIIQRTINVYLKTSNFQLLFDGRQSEFLVKYRASVKSIFIMMLEALCSIQKMYHLNSFENRANSIAHSV